MISYSKRGTFFDAGERTWRVGRDVLLIRATDGREMRRPWRDVVHVRLAYGPTEAKPWRHTFTIAFANAPPETIDNTHFAGIGNFEDRSAAYAPFVRAALERIAAQAPGASAHAGESPLGYAVQVAALAAAVAFLAFILLTLPGVPVTAIVALKLGLLALFTPTLLRWFRSARPRPIDLNALPDDALP